MRSTIIRKIGAIEFPRVEILGIPLDAVEMSQALTVCESFILKKKPHQIIAINANKVVQYHQHSDLAKVISESDLNYIDGTSLTFAGYLFGLRLPRKIGGLVLAERLLELAEIKGYRPYFFGAEDWVIEKAISNYRKKYPRIQIAGYRHGFFKPEEEPGIVEAIAASHPHILFVGFSSPKKELWISKYLKQMNVPLCVGVGGSFDVAAGLYTRSPEWMANCGLEWFYRVMQEPRRLWKRYLMINSLFLLYVLWYRIGGGHD
jgi:N-acetylglucosaminyldiphosphoundecaprenol N-acetyl-beta-D-mannosaminyltransferase